MRRRLFLSLAGAATVIAAGCSTPGAGGGSVPSPASGRELSVREQAVHALNRLAFGPRPGDVEAVQQMGVDRWIETQLHPERVPDAATERLLTAFPAVGMSASELIQKYPRPGAAVVRSRLRGDSMLSPAEQEELRRATQGNRQFTTDLVAWRVARAVASERQLQEVLTDFWHNHFTVFIGKGQVRYYLSDYDRDVIRQHAMGNFRDLLGAVAKSPAMLFYLDNAQSVADSGRPTADRRRGRGMANRRPNRPRRLEDMPEAVRRRLPPEIQDAVARGDTAEVQRRLEAVQQLAGGRPRGLNENYARELLELHTLGVDGGYTQQDVIEVARALTGWSITPPRQGGGEFIFRPEAHDAGEKVVLGHRLRAGRGIEDGEEVLDIVARHPSTARHIARKLAVRFVSDTPSEALVARAAETFTRTDGDIREVVRTIVTSPEFFSREAWRAKVKSPFEFTVSTLRALGARPDTTPITAAVIARLGQPIYGHQAPNGWPETGEAWMNTGAILNRINFGLGVAAGRLPGARVKEWEPYQTLRDASREKQVEGLVQELLGGSASEATRQVLQTGRNPMLDRAGADTSLFDTDRDVAQMSMSAESAERRPNARAARAVGRVFDTQRGSLTGLDQLIGLAIGSPEFQRR